MITPSTLHAHREVEPSEFLLKDDLLDEGRAAAAVLFGPGEPHPSAVVELLVPALVALPQEVFVDAIFFLGLSGGG